jgi:hypothetical protein
MTDKLFLEVSIVLMDPFIINPFPNGSIYCIMDFEAQNNKEARTGLYLKKYPHFKMLITVKVFSHKLDQHA